MFNLMNKRLNKKGFTLIELIVVIAIIAILAVILIPRFTGFTESANKKAAMSDARNILVSLQALQAEGDTSVTLLEIEAYSGTNFAGSISVDPLGAGVGTFNYIYTANDGKTYVVEINAYVIQDEVGVTPAP